MLLLFDIDGTLLISATDDHRDAVHAALRRVWHVEDPAAARIDPAGRTDPEIARAILLQSGVSADRIDARMRDFKRVAAQEYARLCRLDLSPFVAPGVVDVLAALAERPGVRLSLVTGNLEPIARLKLARAGIGRFFERGQGGFGSDHEDRTELPAVARARAGRAGAPYPRERTVVIGDTPLDVACARADGVRCLAVTTGRYDADALRGADAIVPSARELLPLLDQGS
ncbi:MAG TPA: haloacid dehalogenase-like hydrolase [Solirubrobacteraceae bacterium]|nr:haloacid dehalogenase-like hydrolase [Solirubrobacteraceae bacterium]